MSDLLLWNIIFYNMYLLWIRFHVRCSYELDFKSQLDSFSFWVRFTSTIWDGFHLNPFRGKRKFFGIWINFKYIYFSCCIDKWCKKDGESIFLMILCLKIYPKKYPVSIDFLYAVPGHFPIAVLENLRGTIIEFNQSW